jgi:hypothetical protein
VSQLFWSLQKYEEEPVQMEAVEGRIPPAKRTAESRSKPVFVRDVGFIGLHKSISKMRASITNDA